MPGITIGVSGPALKAFGASRGARAAITRATRKAAHTSAREMRAESVRVVRESKRLKIRAIRKAVVLRKNKSRKLEDMEWGVDIRGGMVRLSDYPVRQTKKGVSVEINRGTRSLLKGRFIQFMTNTAADGTVTRHKGVFVRAGKARLPIEEQLGTRPIGVLKERRASRAVTKRGQKAFSKTFKRVLPIEMEKAKR